MQIVGIGNAMMDVIAFVDEAYAPKLGFHNNSVTHLDRSLLGSILEDLPDATISAGGGQPTQRVRPPTSAPGLPSRVWWERTTSARGMLTSSAPRA